MCSEMCIRDRAAAARAAAAGAAAGVRRALRAEVRAELQQLEHDAKVRRQRGPANGVQLAQQRGVRVGGEVGVGRDRDAARSGGARRRARARARLRVARQLKLVAKVL